MTQEHKSKQSSKDAEEASPVEPTAQPEAEKLSGITDDILEDIDDILEENAEVFVNEFIQKGGE